MGGKRLKFPKRKKFVASDDLKEDEKKEGGISPQDHEARMNLLKNLGLVK